MELSGVSAGDLDRVRINNDLVLSMAGSPDTLTLTGFFLDPQYQVEHVVFDDATDWDVATLAALQYSAPRATTASSARNIPRPSMAAVAPTS